MAKFTITINTDNAAFDDAPGQEIGRILRTIADSVEGSMSGTSIRYFTTPVRDINGNTVGKFVFTK